VTVALPSFAAALVLGIGCGWNYTPTDNLLPGSNADESTDTDEPPLDTGETGDDEEVPATYRFDCVDIKSLGDADETVFQVITLENTWSSDIANFKLNILIDLLSEDPSTGEGTITIRSGVGSGRNNQCSQSQTESAEFPVVYAPGVAEWEPSAATGECAAAASSGGAGTYTLEMGADDRVFIYAEDDDGTAFNCSVNPANPDAIPISAVAATITMSEDRSKLAGTLTGCMAEADAQSICSCLSFCGDSQHPDCGGCPGAVPLGTLLGGINPTPNCSNLVGAPAFDIVLEFSARRLNGVPMTCG
jgi:hypothetical protein